MLRETVAEANDSKSDLLGAKYVVEKEREQNDKTKGKGKVEVQARLSPPFTQVPRHKSYSSSSLASIENKSEVQNKNSDEEYRVSDEDMTSDEEEPLSIAVRR
ncbi:hypothetical protein BDP27DRAFT_1433873 [Rhodocollybia butyracea]|uniref:Uncharacterized protein n=1 Tax=Rhodocollybia butyracea TaxID=206335 RepID=A0A9P5P5Y2_9AGAR|nr:hypothetical protein BDP27DRAFT_1433873 [Rhodocollybia butyracea]